MANTINQNIDFIAARVSKAMDLTLEGKCRTHSVIELEASLETLSELRDQLDDLGIQLGKDLLGEV